MFSTVYLYHSKTKNIMTTIEDFTRINNDVNGNPRYVCHFLHFIKDSEDLGSISNEYSAALKRARTLGGRKFHNKQYGGGIVFQSYNLQSLCNNINELMK